MRWTVLARYLNQERIVLVIAGLLFVWFAVTIDKFLSAENLLQLLRNVSVLGILGIGMALVVIGRGIDLSIVSTMAISVAWSLYLMNHGTDIGLALGAGLGLAALVGVLNGLLIAYVEIPPLFATLAMGTFVYGFGRFALIDLDVMYLPRSTGWLEFIGKGQVFGVPMPVIVLAAFVAIGAAFLRFMKFGRFIYGIGDNPLAARITGIPVRPMMVLQYLLASVIGCIAGIVTAAAVSSMNTRIANSTLVYDVILVVVLGGVGLSGGKGGIRNVLVGTLLVGVLLNGMTILDIQFTKQNVIKSAILLIAIIVDSLVNPRDEQTAQQGDI